MKADRMPKPSLPGPALTVAWRELVHPHMTPDKKRSIWQIVNTVVPLAVLYFLMYQSLSYSYWLTLALAFPAGGFTVRAFIIMHDCGHGSFFKSSSANHWVGTICGILVHTPYFRWTHEHAIHHATSGDLDRRGVGDVVTLTIKEYLSRTSGTGLRTGSIDIPSSRSSSALITSFCSDCDLLESIPGNASGEAFT